MVPTSFTILDIIRAHDFVKFSVSVAVMTARRFSPPGVTETVFEGIQSKEKAACEERNSSFQEAVRCMCSREANACFSV